MFASTLVFSQVQDQKRKRANFTPEQLAELPVITISCFCDVYDRKFSLWTHVFTTENLIHRELRQCTDELLSVFSDEQDRNLQECQQQWMIEVRTIGIGEDLLCFAQTEWRKGWRMSSNLRMLKLHWGICFNKIDTQANSSKIYFNLDISSVLFPLTCHGMIFASL